MSIPEPRARKSWSTFVGEGGQGRKVTVRVLFDGTNVNHVNTAAHMRDKERAPVARDLKKRSMRQTASHSEPAFGLTADPKRGPPTAPNP